MGTKADTQATVMVLRMSKRFIKMRMRFKMSEWKIFYWSTLHTYWIGFDLDELGTLGTFVPTSSRFWCESDTSRESSSETKVKWKSWLKGFHHSYWQYLSIKLVASWVFLWRLRSITYPRRQNRMKEAFRIEDEELVR